MPAAPTLDKLYKAHKDFETAINTLRGYLKGIGSIVITREDEARIILPMDKVELYVDSNTLVLEAGKAFTLNYTSEGGSLETRVFADDHIASIIITSGVVVGVYVGQGSVVLILRLAYVGESTRVIIKRFARDNNPG